MTAEADRNHREQLEHELRREKESQEETNSAPPSVTADEHPDPEVEKMREELVRLQQERSQQEEAAKLAMKIRKDAKKAFQGNSLFQQSTADYVIKVTELQHIEYERILREMIEEERKAQADRQAREQQVENVGHENSDGPVDTKERGMNTVVIGDQTFVVDGRRPTLRWEDVNRRIRPIPTLDSPPLKQDPVELDMASSSRLESEDHDGPTVVGTHEKREDRPSLAELMYLAGARTTSDSGDELQ